MSIEFCAKLKNPPHVEPSLLAEANCISRWHKQVSFSVQIRYLLLVLYMTVLSGMTGKWLRIFPYFIYVCTGIK